MAAARRKNDGSTGVKAAFDRMDLNGRIVDVRDAVDPARRCFAEIVPFRLMHALLVQLRRVRRIERDYNATLEDRLRRIRAFVGWTGMRNVQRHESRGWVGGGVSGASQSRQEGDHEKRERRNC